jgi:hypothetical protein
MDILNMNILPIHQAQALPPLGPVLLPDILTTATLPMAVSRTNRPWV